ncbi:MAG: MscL family protein [Candidatus Saccharimonadales bacterium]
MATQPNDDKKSLPPAEKHRQVEEIKTKLSNLSPGAAAEAVNEVVTNQARKQVSGFTEFLREQSVISIGIGLVLGIQIKAVVDTIMASFVNPVTELLLPGQQALSAKTFMMTIGSKEVAIGWGAIAYSLFTFIMVAILIYVGYKLLRLDKLAKKKD